MKIEAKARLLATKLPEGKIYKDTKSWFKGFLNNVHADSALSKTLMSGVSNSMHESIRGFRWESGHVEFSADAVSAMRELKTSIDKDTRFKKYKNGKNVANTPHLETYEWIGIKGENVPPIVRLNIPTDSEYIGNVELRTERL